MLSFLSLCRSRPMPLLAACALVLTQAACAHPVAFEPAVVVQARVGGPVHGSVHVPAYPPQYGPQYGPPPVVVLPPTLHPVPPSLGWGAPAVVVPVRPWVHPGHHPKAWRGSSNGWGRGDHRYR